jgi:hypothetical protein
VANTSLQEVWDSYFIKVPEEDFTYKKSQVYQYFKTAIAKSYKTTSDSLKFSLYTTEKELIVYNIAGNNGKITINLDSNTYTVNLLSTDTILEIANKILAVIPNTYTVDFEDTKSYPIIIIKSSSTISLSYTDTDNTNVDIEIDNTYNGEFDSEINQDTIELLTLNMKKEYLRGKLSVLDELKQHLGTKDFNRLPEKANEYKYIQQSMSDLDEEIFSFRQEFYSYKN